MAASAPRYASKSMLTRLLAPFASAYRSQALYPRMGLLYDDLIQEETPVVQEALRRLPQELSDARVFRLKRAMQLSLMHQELPKAEWTQEAEDVRYLSPVIEQVQQEFNEKLGLDTMTIPS